MKPIPTKDAPQVSGGYGPNDIVDPPEFPGLGYPPAPGGPVGPLPDPVDPLPQIR
jgi:hypothetical protein